MKHRETSTSISDRVLEILEATPAAAARGKGFLERIARFTEALGVWGARTNLTAHPEDPVEVAFHVIDSLAPLFVTPPLNLFGPQTRVLDLGSGAGYPGLILAAASDAEFILIESRRKRASFLSASATEMGLTNVTVICRRATPATVGEDFDVLTSRAVGEASIEIAAKALRPGGVALLWASPEQQIAAGLFRAAGLSEPIRHEYVVRRGSAVARRSLLVARKSLT